MNSGGSTSRSADVSNAANSTEEEITVDNNMQVDNGGRRRYTGEFIADEKARVMTYRRRNKGLKKKIYELSTLCDVDACMIMYGPEHRNHEPVLDTWPENQNEVHRILNRYFESEEGKKGRIRLVGSTNGQETIEEEIAKQKKKNELMESLLWDNQIDGLCEDQLRELSGNLDLRSKMVEARLAGIECNQDLPREVVRNG